MLRAVPFVIAAIAIVALTYVEGSITDRWVDGNLPSEYCASLLDRVPMTIGKWEGVDEKVDEEIQKVAGAQGYVSRTYTHATTGQRVDVWLIVGHARDTAEHTPDSCYPGSGFNQKDRNATYEIEAPGQPAGEFWTAVFYREDTFGTSARRVFWSWFKPALGSDEAPAEIAWIAPNQPRFYFGSTRALYKLYFTAAAAVDEPADDSVCLEFAAEFLPIVNGILVEANDAIPAGFAPVTADDPTA